MKNRKIIAVDFDGTCVTHEFPNVGEEVSLCVSVLKLLLAEGHKLILYTMRSGVTLDDAVRWFEARGVTLYAVNSNPTQYAWTKSPKIYAHLYIDDAALGVPLIEPSDGGRAYVDWLRVMELLHRNEFLTKNSDIRV